MHTVRETRQFFPQRPCQERTRSSHACSRPVASFYTVPSTAATLLVDVKTHRKRDSRREPRVIDRWPPRLAPGSSAFCGGVSQLDRQGLRPFRPLTLSNNRQAVRSETLPRTFTAHTHHAHMLSHTSAHVSPSTQALKTRRADRAEWLVRARNEHAHAAGWADARRRTRQSLLLLLLLLLPQAHSTHARGGDAGWLAGWLAAAAAAADCCWLHTPAVPPLRERVEGGALCTSLAYLCRRAPPRQPELAPPGRARAHLALARALSGKWLEHAANAPLPRRQRLGEAREAARRVSRFDFWALFARRKGKGWRHRKQGSGGQ